MSKEEIKHDADLAGGEREVVYSYDGEDPEPVSFPVSTTNDTNNIDSSEGMSAEQAFEVFAGKLVIPNPYSKKKGKDAPVSQETPLERLGRIQRELEELKGEIIQSKDDGNEKDTSSSSQLLSDQLAKMQVEHQRLSIAQIQKQQQLSASIQASVDGIKDAVAADTTPVPAPPAAAPEDMSHLEEILKRLEISLGSTGTVGASSSSCSSNKSLLERVQSLESKSDKLDDKKLDVLHKRAKVIRQDLEAAAKARNKLSSLSSSSSSSSDDAKKIAALYDELQQLNGMSQHLPVLCSRLQALAHQHVDAATRTARLQATEQVVGTLQQKLQSMESAMSNLETTVQQNAKSMQENVVALEERMKSVSST